MSHHLQLNSSDATPQLAPAVAEALSAARADELPVGKLTLSEVGRAFNQWISRMSFALGYSRTMLVGTDLFEMAAECAKMVQRNFPAFKLSEVDLAMRYGGAGEYRRDPDKPVLVAVDTIAYWLRSYRDSARADAVAAGQRLSESATPKLPPPQVDYVGSVVALIQQARDTCLPVGYELDLGNQVYDWLKSIGAFTGWRPAAYYADMRAEEADRVLLANKSTTGPARIEYNVFLAALGQGQLPEGHPLSRSVLNACKKRVLREWLIQHAADETDMLALLADLKSHHQPA
jgi:hypothetical protein